MKNKKDFLFKNLFLLKAPGGKFAVSEGSNYFI